MSKPSLNRTAAIAPRPSRVVAHYLALGSTDIPELLAPMSDSSIGLLAHRATTLASARSMLRVGTIQLIVAGLDEIGRLDGAWPELVALGVPMLVIANREVDEAETESLRRRGASHIVRAPLDRERDRLVMSGLARASRWMTANVSRLPLADVLQTMASHRQSGMLYVSTSSPTLMENVHEAEAHPHGRVYVVDGQLVHAETETGATGIAAFAAILALADATFWTHEVFLAPAVRTITVSLTTALLHAAWCSDESDRGDEAPTRSLPPPVTWNPPAARASVPPVTTVIEPEAVASEPGGVMSKMDTLLKNFPELRIVAAADQMGSVVETSGTGDAESLCAAVALTRVALERAGELMGVGAPSGYTVLSDKHTVYVHESGRGFVAALGEPNKSAESTARKIVAAHAGK